MKILVIGSGAREHAIAAALQRSPQNPQLYCFGTTMNPGISSWTNDYVIGDITDCTGIVHSAKQWEIELAIIGPEAPLESGVADALWAAGIPTIGPRKALAQIETSKHFARDLMKKYAIPGLPNFRQFKTMQEIEAYLQTMGEGNYVVKANGLMGGKGVKISGEHLHSIEESLSFCQSIFAKNQQVLIEEKLVGEEFSCMCFVDGERLIPMPLVQDHKRAFVGDCGPNTGGMGSYSDANHKLPFLSEFEVDEALKINEAVFKALGLECNERYIGILYGSFIATAKGVYAIEFNARMGDPEALNVLSILQSDFVAICMSMIKGELTTDQVVFRPHATVCKYAVPEGYPDASGQQFPVDYSQVEDRKHLFLAAVHDDGEQVIATGSRTLAFVGVAPQLSDAECIAEEEIERVKGALFHRQDIGTSTLIQRRIDHMHKLRAS